jgi:hypothetical protein
LNFRYCVFAVHVEEKHNFCLFIKKSTIWSAVVTSSKLSFAIVQKLSRPLVTEYKGVTKRCRRSWPTNGALVYEPKYGEREEFAGVQQMSTDVFTQEPK